MIMNKKKFKQQQRQIAKQLRRLWPPWFNKKQTKNKTTKWRPRVRAPFVACSFTLKGQNSKQNYAESHQYGERKRDREKPRNHSNQETITRQQWRDERARLDTTLARKNSKQNKPQSHSQLCSQDHRLDVPFCFCHYVYQPSRTTNLFFFISSTHSHSHRHTNTPPHQLSIPVDFSALSRVLMAVFVPSLAHSLFPVPNEKPNPNVLCFDQQTAAFLSRSHSISYILRSHHTSTHHTHNTTTKSFLSFIIVLFLLFTTFCW